jgi:hypothetical protein
MNDTTEPPEVIAYALPDNIHWVMWCEDCRRWHYHGAGPGHRVAHCHSRASRYDHLGYILAGGEPAPAWVKKDLDRKRPRGPARLPCQRTLPEDLLERIAQETAGLENRQAWAEIWTRLRAEEPSKQAGKSREVVWLIRKRKAANQIPA